MTEAKGISYQISNRRLLAFGKFLQPIPVSLLSQGLELQPPEPDGKKTCLLHDHILTYNLSQDLQLSFLHRVLFESVNYRFNLRKKGMERTIEIKKNPTGRAVNLLSDTLKSL